VSREIHKLLGPMSRRLRLMAARGIIASISDAPKQQRSQVSLLAGEVRDNVERFQEYGFTSVPFPGAEGVFLSLNGSRDQGVMICIADRRYRLTGLRPGEAALHDDQGQKVHLTRDGIVVSTPKKCRIEALDIELHASHSYSWDVDGYGERWTSLGGGTYEHKTWQTGAVVVPDVKPINPPEGP